MAVEPLECLEEELWTECQTNAADDANRARGVMKDGRRFGRPPDPFEPPATPGREINVTDPDSRNVKTPRGCMQGYNAQAALTEAQIVIAAEVTIDSLDFGHLEPMVAATASELAAIGLDAPQVVVADAGYWHQVQIDNMVERVKPSLPQPLATRAQGGRVVHASWRSCPRALSTTCRGSSFGLLDNAAPGSLA